MSRRLQVDIIPQNGQLRLIVHGDALAQAGQTLADRPLLALDQQEVAALRRGDATPALIQHLSATVSQWLLGADLNTVLTMALNQPNAQPIRLVFSLTDEQAWTGWEDVPVELTVLQGGNIPLVVRPKIASIVHLLPKVGAPASTLATVTWPLRILIVRSNPHDLGGAVPEAGPICAGIRAIRPDLDASRLHVDLLSNEASPYVVGRPTPEQFRQRLKASYDILVYLGHGDVLQAHPGVPPVGLLQLESDDGSVHVSMAADQLAVSLHNWPVPVVLVVGCLTAAGIDPALKGDIDSEMPTWIKGSQGVAQALVNSESGVQVAVGMRYRLESNDAKVFLRAFFQSLLKDSPGDIEAAVRSARVELNVQPGNQPGSWSAPVMFSTLPDEPMYGFLAAQGLPTCPALDVRYQTIRTLIWNDLAAQSWSRRAADGLASMQLLRTANEQDIRQTMLAHGAYLAPVCTRAEVPLPVNLPVELHGMLTVSLLQGKLVIGSPDASVVTVTATQALTDAGFDILFSVGKNHTTFRLETDGAPRQLPTGELFTVTISFGPSTGVWYPVTIEGLEVDPPSAVCPGSNAIFAPPE